jgi:hypothetical protein
MAEAFEDLLQWQLLAIWGDAIFEDVYRIDDNVRRASERQLMYADDLNYVERELIGILNGHPQRIKIVTYLIKHQFIALDT